MILSFAIRHIIIHSTPGFVFVWSRAVLPGFPDRFWSLRLPHSIWSNTVFILGQRLLAQDITFVPRQPFIGFAFNTGIHTPDVVGLTALTFSPRPVYGSGWDSSPHFASQYHPISATTFFSWLFNSFVSVFIDHPSHVPALAFCNFVRSPPFIGRTRVAPLHFKHSPVQCYTPSILADHIIPHLMDRDTRVVTKGRNLDVTKQENHQEQNRQVSYQVNAAAHRLPLIFILPPRTVGLPVSFRRKGGRQRMF